MSPIVSKQGPLKCATPCGMYLGLESECVGQVEKIPSSLGCYPPSPHQLKTFPSFYFDFTENGDRIFKNCSQRLLN